MSFPAEVMELDIKGYEGHYRINENGTIFSICRKNKIKRKDYIHISKGKSYRRIHLQKNNISKQILVHRLVAEAFIPNPNNYPQVNHKDNDGLNNKISNLEWCSASYNIDYSKAGEYKLISPKGILTFVRNLSKFCRDMNLNLGCISHVIAGNRKHHKGWKLA